MSGACLVDLSKCMGCRGCQVACKQWNDLPAEKTTFFAGTGGYQNPPELSSSTFTLVGYTEVVKDGKLKWVFAKRQCMSCLDPACVEVCPMGGISKTQEGAVVYDSEKCIGCRTCLLNCPFQVPAFDTTKEVPAMSKCNLCASRLPGDWFEKELNGKPMSLETAAKFKEGLGEPICVKTCSAGALVWGERSVLLAEATRRLKENPEKYIQHIYGEKEAGGTTWMYISSVPFEDLGFRTDVKYEKYPLATQVAMREVPVAASVAMAGFYWLVKRKNAAANGELETEEREAAAV